MTDSARHPDRPVDEFVSRLEQAEKERDGLKGALDTTMIAATRRAAERDRLAAALEPLVIAVDKYMGATESLVYKGQQTRTATFDACLRELDRAAEVARDALASREQTP